jgi:hypothetical protein
VGTSPCVGAWLDAFPESCWGLDIILELIPWELSWIDGIELGPAYLLEEALLLVALAAMTQVDSCVKGLGLGSMTPILKDQDALMRLNPVQLYSMN